MQCAAFRQNGKRVINYDCRQGLYVPEGACDRQQLEAGCESATCLLLEANEILIEKICTWHIGDTFIMDCTCLF